MVDLRRFGVLESGEVIDVTSHGVNLLRSHAKLKKIRGRGEEIQSHLAWISYLQQLEDELKKIHSLLNEAWVTFDTMRDFRKCQNHADRAQQRLHRVIKKLRKQ